MTRASLTLLALVQLFAAPAVAQIPADTIPLTMREKIVRDTRELIDKRFAHFAGIPGYDFPAEFDRYREKALATSSRWDFSLQTRAFIASLKNGHTTYGDSWMRDADPAGLPFTLSHVGGQWIVSASRHPELKIGDVVHTIDGESVEHAYTEQARYISASSDRARRREFTSRGFLWPRRITLGLDEARTVSVERSVPPRDTAAPQAIVRDHWIDEGQVGYIAIGSFGEPAHEAKALELIASKYRGARALVIDVRGNGGGNTPRDLIKTLLNGKEFSWWKEDPYRLPNAMIDRMGAAMKRRGGASSPFAGKVIVLSDGNCGSACEDFILPLKWQKRAIVVGDTTAGTTGQPVFLRFDNGIQITASAKRAWFPDGAPFEGVGIAPDVAVPVTRQDLIDRADRAMAAAVEVARKP